MLATQQLSELSTELSRVRANRGAAEATAESVRAAHCRAARSLDALPEVLSSELIQRLRERQVQLKADIADLSTTLLDNHPRIRALRSQLADLDGQIRGEAQKVLKGLETAGADRADPRKPADRRPQHAEGRVGTRRRATRSSCDALEREAAAQRELLESYLTRYREASSRKDRNYLPVDARIFSERRRTVRALFPEDRPDRRRGLRRLAADHGDRDACCRSCFRGRAMRPAARCPLRAGRRAGRACRLPGGEPAIAGQMTVGDGAAEAEAQPDTTTVVQAAAENVAAADAEPARTEALGEISIERRPKD